MAELLVLVLVGAIAVALGLWVFSHLGMVLSVILIAALLLGVISLFQGAATKWEEGDRRRREIDASELLTEYAQGRRDFRRAIIRFKVGSDNLLRGADLRGVLLDGAELKEANLEKADLREAELCSAKLEGANLNGADLRKADLRSADLRYAHLEGARLEDARLKGAVLWAAHVGAAAPFELRRLAYHPMKPDAAEMISECTARGLKVPEHPDVSNSFW